METLEFIISLTIASYSHVPAQKALVSHVQMPISASSKATLRLKRSLEENVPSLQCESQERTRTQSDGGLYWNINGRPKGTAQTP